MADIERRQLLAANDTNTDGSSKRVLPGQTSYGNMKMKDERGPLKKYKWAIIIGVVVLVVALVLGLTLKKKAGNNPIPPVPPPPGPGPTPGGYFNPYSVDPASIDQQVNKLTGVLNA
jgi:hypothetical protein